MKTLFVKDRSRRACFEILEKKRWILTYIIQNSSLDLATREFAYAEIRNLMRFNSSTKIRNRCILTNRARAVYRKVKISRIFFKKLTLQGDLCGLKKSSW